MTEVLNPEPLLWALHNAGVQHIIIGGFAVNAHVMQWIAGIDTDPAYDALAGAAIDGELDGIPLRVCGLEHLIAMKRAAGRPRDLDDLRRLGVD